VEADISMSVKPAFAAVVTRIVGDQAYTRAVMRDEKGECKEFLFGGDVTEIVCMLPEAEGLHDWLSVELLTLLTNGA
jgi:hypothetical protein